MAHWRKIVVSGSDARLKSLIVTNNIEAGLGASVASVTASNSAPIELPNISLLPRTYTPLVIDEDGSGTGTGKIFRGAPYAPAVGGEGSSTVGVSGSLPNNIAIIGSGSTFVQTASVLQPVDFNNASIGNIRNLTSSGDISMSNGTLKINTLEAPQQPDFSVLLIDTSTGEVHHTGSYTNTTSYLDLADVPKGIVSSSDQVIAYLSGSGILSSSEQIAQDISGSWQGYISGSGIFSSSAQFSDDFLATNAFTTSSISGSWQGYISGSGIISSSTQFTTESDATFGDISANDITASGHITTSGHISASDLFIQNNAIISGNLDINGSVDFDSFNFIEDNIISITGSNSFGSTASLNRHTFTGSIVVSGSSGISIENGSGTQASISSSGALTVTSALINGNTNITGHITASGNISSSGDIIADSVTALTLSGILQTAAQPNITSLGTLSSLSVNNVISASNISASGYISASELLATDGIFGTLQTGAQPNITSIGILDAIELSGAITASNISASGFVSASKFIGIFGGVISSSLQFTSQSDVEFRNITASIISASSTVYAKNLILSGGTDVFTSASLAAAVSNDNLGNHSASKNLSLENFDLNNVQSITGSTFSIVSSSLGSTFTGDIFDVSTRITVPQITASIISASGGLFAKLLEDPFVEGSDEPALRTVVYDPNSGSFFFTGSYGSGGGAGVGFPFEGNASITGSLNVSGSETDITRIHTPVEMKSNVIIDGNLIVQGETTTINVNDLTVEDRFITIGSGSTNLPDTDVGILFDVKTVDGTGSAFFFDHSEDRFAVGKEIQNDIGNDNSVGGGGIGAGSHAGFVVTTILADNDTNPNQIEDSAKFGMGELRILKNGDIYIYTTGSN